MNAVNNGRNKKIIIFSTYPHVNPQHGGQKRADAIVSRYKSLGMDVKYVGIYAKDSYSSHGADDMYITSTASLSHLNHANKELIGDLAVGWISRNDEDLYARLVKSLRDFEPDIIQVEQPYLIPFINRLRLDGFISWQKFVYSSHNIEHAMKEEMLLDVPYIAEDRRLDIVSQISALEDDAIHQSDIVIAVTESDATYLTGRNAREVIVAPNGINPPQHSDRQVETLMKYYEKKSVEKTILFVGSWHTPNWKGFLDMVSTGLGFLPHNTKIIIVGGISGLIEEYFIGRSVTERTCFLQRVEMLGRISEERLGAVIRCADIIILPITSGGGSNLKTAEAIYNRKHTVTTNYAMRGYDQSILNLPYLHIVSSADDFRSTMKQLALSAPSFRLTDEQEISADSVLWERTLKNLEKVSEG